MLSHGWKRLFLNFLQNICTCICTVICVLALYSSQSMVSIISLVKNNPCAISMQQHLSSWLHRFRGDPGLSCTLLHHRVAAEPVGFMNEHSEARARLPPCLSSYYSFTKVHLRCCCERSHCSLVKRMMKTCIKCFEVAVQTPWTMKWGPVPLLFSKGCVDEWGGCMQKHITALGIDPCGWRWDGPREDGD